MTIFIPVNVCVLSEVSPTTYDLMRDYAVLTEAVVANNTTWINMWVESKAIQENIQLIFEILRNNVCPELWAKALEDCQDFSGVQQGGPLMFYLVMRHILNISEASILALVAQMKAIKINKIVGEDVEEAVGTVKATLKVLTQCSTDVRNFVPDDIEVSVLQIFQTSSLDEFNEIFRREEMNARAIADKHGGIPLYPTVQETCQQASNAYRHLTGPGDGYKWVKKPKQGVHFTHNGPTNARKCFNCGKPG